MAFTTAVDEFFAAEERERVPILREQSQAFRRLFDEPPAPAYEVAKAVFTPLNDWYAVETAAKDAVDENKTLKKDEEELDGTNETVVDDDSAEWIDRTPTSPRPYGLWRTICNAVEKLTDYNDRLVELVLECPNVGNNGDLYLLDMHLTEFGFNVFQPASTESETEREQKRQGWVNMNAFCAKLAKHRTQDGIENCRLDQRSRGSLALRRALEMMPWENFHHPDLDAMLEEDPEEEWTITNVRYQLECRDVRSLDFWAPAAAVWMIIDAQSLYEMEGGRLIGEWDHNPSTWKGATGWSKDRFRYWRERFVWISKVTALDARTRASAVEAAERMGVVLGEKQVAA